MLLLLLILYAADVDGEVRWLSVLYRRLVGYVVKPVYIVTNVGRVFIETPPGHAPSLLVMRARPPRRRPFNVSQTHDPQLNQRKMTSIE